MKYRREIDGLRAIAVLPVILFHAGFKMFEGGFVGVDVFFVISGYLITTIILSDMNEGKFSLLTFYERRSRRILPVLFFVILCCVPFAWFWLLPNHFKSFSKSITAVTVFSSNILFWKESGYFGIESELKPLLHTWSLAVEEQYYVIFPIILMVLWKFRKRWIFGSLVVIAVFSLSLAQWGSNTFPSASFFLLPMRFWELAIGALIAFFFVYKVEHEDFVSSNKNLSEIFGLIGLGLICYSIFSFNQSTPFPSVYALIPTVGTAFVVMFSTSNTIAGRLLSTKILVGIGLLSYSAYLWHQPVFAFARHRLLSEPHPFLLVALSILSIVLAYFSWRFVELPFRDKKRLGRKKVFVFSIVGSIALAAMGLFGRMNNGHDERVIGSGVRLAVIQEKISDDFGLNVECDDKFTLSSNCRTSDEPEILIWGDSYAMHLVKGVMASNPQAKIIQMTKSTCGPFFDIAPITPDYPVAWANGCLDFNNSVRDWLKSNNTVKYAVISSPFSTYLEQRKFQLLIDGKIIEANNKVAIEKFEKTLDELRRIGIEPIVFSPPPQNGSNIGQCLVTAELFGGDPNGCDFKIEDATEISKEVRGFLEKISVKNKVIFLEDEICESGICKGSVENTFIYRDTGHLSQNGSMFIGKKMKFYDLIVGRKT